MNGILRVTTIAVLFKLCHPMTILCAIKSIVIAPVQFFAQWAFAHVSQEICKQFPTFAHINSASRVVFKLFPRRFSTASMHTVPSVIGFGWSFYRSMAVGFSGLVFPAAARFGVPITKFSVANKRQNSAIALTNATSSMLSISIKLYDVIKQNCELSKPLSFDRYFGRHSNGHSLLSLVAGAPHQRALVTIFALCWMFASAIVHAQPVSGPATATSNSVTTFLDNKHLRNNPALLFDGTNLTINGVPVLTNAGSIGPGTVNRIARWTGTNTLGDGRVIDTGTILSMGFPTNDVPNLAGITNITYAIGIGRDALSGATITNSNGIYAIGENALTSATIKGSGGVHAFGSSAGDSLSVLGLSSEIHAIGENALQVAVITNTTQHIYAYGRGALGYSSLNLSGDLYSFGTFNLDSSVVTNSSQIYSFGENGLGNSRLTNTSDLYTFGKDAGANLSGVFSHVFLIGSGATATGNNQWVAGDSAYQYLFPGTAGFILGGTTNQITFGGTNTAPVSAVAPTKWISVQVAGLTNSFRIPLFE